MSLALGSTVAEIKLNAAQLFDTAARAEKALNNLNGAGADAFAPAERSAQSFSTKLDGVLTKIGKVGDRMKSIGTGLTLGVTMPILGGGAFALNQASDLNEEMAKNEVVFGEHSDQILKYVEGSNQALGLSQTEALNASGTYGSLFKTMGIGTEESAKLSTGLIGLSADFGAFHNISSSQANTAFISGLTGEYEPLKRYGIFLNAATVEQKALEMGLADTTGELTEQDKVLARHAMITDQASQTTGYFAAESEGFAGQMRIFRATLKDVAAGFGQLLLPAATRAIGVIGDLLQWVHNLSPAMKTWVVGIAAAAAALGPLLVVLGTVAGAISNLGPVVKGVMAGVRGLGLSFALLTSPVTLVIAAVAALAIGAYFLYQKWEPFRNVVDATASALRDFATGPALDFLKKLGGALNALAVQPALKFFQDMGGKIAKALAPVGDLITQMIGTFQAFRSIGLDPVSAALQALGSVVPTLSPLMNSLTDVVDNVTDAFRAFVDGDFGTGLDHLGDAVGNVGDAFGDLSGLVDRARSFAGGLFDDLARKAGVFGDTVRRVGAIFETGLDAWSSLLSGIGKLIRGDVSGAFADFGDAALAIIRNVGNAMLLFPQMVVDMFQAVPWSDVGSTAVDLLTAGLRVAGSAASGLWSWLTESLSTAFDDVRTAVGLGISLAWDQITSLNWSQYVSPVVWDVFVAGVNLAARVGAFLWDWFVTAVDLAAKVGSFLWSSFVTAVDLAKKVGTFAWSAFITAVDLAKKVGSFAWSAFVTSVDLAAKVGSFLWSSFITSVDLAAKVGTFLWSSFVVSVDLGLKVASLVWSGFVTTVDLTTKAGSLLWSVFVTAVDLTLKVGELLWSGFVTAVDLTLKVAGLAWSGFVTAVDLAAKVGAFLWSSFVTSVDLAAKVGAFLWSSFVTSVDLAAKVGSFLWSSFVTAVDLAAKVGDFLWSTFVTGITWSDFVPDVTWSDFIPDLTWPAITKEDILNAIVPGGDPFGGDGEGGGAAGGTTSPSVPTGGGAPTAPVGGGFPGGGGGSGLNLDFRPGGGGPALGLLQIVNSANQAREALRSLTQTTTTEPPAWSPPIQTAGRTARHALIANVIDTGRNVGQMLTGVTGQFQTQPSLWAPPVRTAGTSIRTAATTAFGGVRMAAQTGIGGVASLIGMVAPTWVPPVRTAGTMARTSLNTNMLGMRTNTAVNMNSIRATTAAQSAAARTSIAVNSAGGRASLAGANAGMNANQLATWAGIAGTTATQSAAMYSSTSTNASQSSIALAGSNAGMALNQTVTWGGMVGTAASQGAAMASETGSAAGRAAAGMAGGMGNATGAVSSNAGRWPGIVAGAGGGMFSAGFGVGSQATRGVASGMLSLLGSVISAANRIVSVVLSALNAAAQIASPAKRFFRPGRMITAGVGVGAEQGIPMAERAAERVVGSMGRVFTRGAQYEAVVQIGKPRPITGDVDVSRPGRGVAPLVPPVSIDTRICPDWTKRVEHALVRNTGQLANGLRYSESHANPRYYEAGGIGRNGAQTVTIVEHNYALHREDYKKVIDDSERGGQAATSLGRYSRGRTTRAGRARTVVR